MKGNIDKAEDEIKKAIENLYKEYKLCVGYADPTDISYAKKTVDKFVRRCLGNILGDF